jgi:hypothetical protein
MEGEKTQGQKRENLIMSKHDKNEASLIQFMSSHKLSL